MTQIRVFNVLSAIINDDTDNMRARAEDVCRNALIDEFGNINVLSVEAVEGKSSPPEMSDQDRHDMEGFNA